MFCNRGRQRVEQKSSFPYRFKKVIPWNELTHNLVLSTSFYQLFWLVGAVAESHPQLQGHCTFWTVIPGIGQSGGSSCGGWHFQTLVTRRWNENHGRGRALDKEGDPPEMTTNGVPTLAHIFQEPTKLLRGLPDFCLQLNSAKNFEGHTQVMPAAWFKPGAPTGTRGSPGFLLFPFNLTESY